jgi:hypothetical protein
MSRSQRSRRSSSTRTSTRIANLISEAEVLQASGDVRRAIQHYRRWLQSPASPEDSGIVHFNLGLLLRDIGDLAGARQAFAAALEQKADFSQARAALAQLLPIVRENDSTRDIRLFAIGWSPETIVQTDPNIAILDNSANPRPDWYEYWTIRHYLLHQSLDADSHYGFLSPKFADKTGLSGADVIRFIRDRPDADVFTFSPQADMGAFFLNVFEQGETFDPGFLDICQELLAAMAYSVDWPALVMDSRQIVFSNFIVARPTFWQQWLDLCEKIFHLAEAGDSPLAAKLNAPTTYRGWVPRKVFVIERMASLLLASGQWKCAPYSTFQCAWSALPTSEFRTEAIASDALKMAWNETKDRAYIDAYVELRKRVFGR